MGNINIAGDGVITVMQAAAMAGRPIFPVPLPRPASSAASSSAAGLADFSHDQMQFLAFGRGLDTTRMREVLGFEPLYTTRAAFQDFAPHVTAVRAGWPATAVNVGPGCGRAAANALVHALNGRGA